METKMRILIADPNQDFCRLISETFDREADLEVVGTAQDGVDALRLLAELKPDLLLMDLVLPKLDGLELLRRMPETGAHCSIIVLSGFVNNKVISDCSSRGVDYFMPKPCDTSALLGRSMAAPMWVPSPLPVWIAASRPWHGGRMRIWRLWSPTSSMKSAFPPISRAINTCGRPSSSPLRTWI